MSADIIPFPQPHEPDITIDDLIMITYQTPTETPTPHLIPRTDTV